jgi:hypothetical protein
MVSLVLSTTRDSFTTLFSIVYSFLSSSSICDFFSMISLRWRLISSTLGSEHF